MNDGVYIYPADRSTAWLTMEDVGPYRISNNSIYEGSSTPGVHMKQTKFLKILSMKFVWTQGVEHGANIGLHNQFLLNSPTFPFPGIRTVESI